MGLVRDDGVEVPEQEHPLVPVAAERSPGAWSGDGTGRARSASSGGWHAAARSSAPWKSPDGDDTPTSASSSRTARFPISAAAARTQGSMPPDGTVFAMIEAGEKAPEFTLPDQDGEEVSLSDFAGRTLVLYFYPKADTPGCTTQACSIRDRAADYEAADAVVVGISPDPVGRVKSSTAASR